MIRSGGSRGGFLDDKTKDKRTKLRNEMTNRAEGELGEAKSRKAGIKVKKPYIS